MSQCDLSPLEVRKLIRANKYVPSLTKLHCPGYKRATLTIVHKKYADDFHNVAMGTKSALPILYKSKVGQFSAESLGSDIDARTDLTAYTVFKSGEITEQETDLLDYDLSDYVFFYFGCSYSFYGLLFENKLISPKEEDEGLCGIYKTNIDAYKSGVFNAKVIVTMSYFRKDRLSELAALLDPLDDVHGAPIHYGNPAIIGINVDEDNIGNKVNRGENEVPVFFSCGKTAHELMKSPSLELAFSYKSDNTFLVTDIVQDSLIEREDKNKIPFVFEYNFKDERYSVMSIATLEKLNKLAQILGYSTVEKYFNCITTALSHATCVTLATTRSGSNKNLGNEITGIVSLVCALQALNKRITVTVEESSLHVYKEILHVCYNERVIKDNVVILSRNDLNNNEKIFEKDETSLCDVVVSVDGFDNCGRGSPTELNSECQIASESKQVITGRNNIGLSAYGCYGIVFGIFALRSCKIHERYFRRAIGFPVDALKQMGNILPTPEKSGEILKILESFGIISDRLLLANEHATVIQSMRNVVGL